MAVCLKTSDELSSLKFIVLFLVHTLEPQSLQFTVHHVFRQLEQTVYMLLVL
jgi:hypothetical protein